MQSIALEFLYVIIEFSQHSFKDGVLKTCTRIVIKADRPYLPHSGSAAPQRGFRCRTSTFNSDGQHTDMYVGCCLDAEQNVSNSHP